MIEPPSDLPADVPGHKLSGVTWAALAFVAGTLFALLPMYYFYAGTTTPQRDTAGTPAATTPADATVQAATEPADRFAARMSYELSQMPEELPVRATPSTPVAVEPAALAVEPPAPIDERFASRVANARPISSTPPDLRDTTREIENEALRAEYRQPHAPSKVRAEAVSQRAGDVREGAAAVKASIATRPIGTTVVSGASRNDGEPGPGIAAAAGTASPERKSGDGIAKAGPVVSGVTPIGPAPESADGRETPRKDSTAGAGAEGIESRLAATREWLSVAPQTMHTIQIMGTSSEEQLKNQLRALAKVLEPQKIYVFRTLAQGKPAMTVVYGGYADRRAAMQALEKLPPSISANRPVLRTVHGIRSELKQNGIKAES